MVLKLAKRKKDQKQDLEEELHDLRHAVAALKGEKRKLLIDLDLAYDTYDQDISIFEYADDSQEAKAFDAFVSIEDPFLEETRRFLLDNDDE